MYYCNSSISEFDINKVKKLKTQHDALKDDNISKFLLNKIGIDSNKVLVTNASGSKKTLGFRGIANLSLIDETKIISEEKSPIYDKESTDDTYCKSLFRFLLTQKDDIECEEIEKRDIKKAKLDAKIEYVNNEIDNLKEEKDIIVEQLKNNESVSNIDEYEKEVSSLEKIIDKKQGELKYYIKEQDELNVQRNKIRLLLDKFHVLRNQYTSDLKRLNFIESGSECLNQIHINHCPLCNNEVTFDDVELETIIPACEKEKIEIEKKVIELNKTITELSIENEIIVKEINKYKQYIESNTGEIKDILSTQLNPLKEVISNTIKLSNTQNKLQDVEYRIVRKEIDIIAFEERKKEKQSKLNYNFDIPEDIYNEFCKSIKDTLLECNYRSVNEIQFDIKEQDIKIDGVERKTNGKGYRAYFYSVFSIALLNFLIAKEYPYTRVLILDSPITTLKEEDIEKGKIEEGDMIEESLQDSLFIALAKDCSDKQLIIIENKELPKQVKGKCNHIVFTKEKNRGRYGFFPLKK